jgi:hypothetical protein
LFLFFSSSSLGFARRKRTIRGTRFPFFGLFSSPDALFLNFHVVRRFESALAIGIYVHLTETIKCPSVSVVAKKIPRDSRPENSDV